MQNSAASMTFHTSKPDSEAAAAKNTHSRRKSHHARPEVVRRHMAVVIGRMVEEMLRHIRIVSGIVVTERQHGHVLPREESPLLDKNRPPVPSRHHATSGAHALRRGIQDRPRHECSPRRRNGRQHCQRNQ